MATRHATLLWLPDALRDADIAFRVLSGWDYNKQGYYWTDPSNNHHGYYGDPNGHILHHTATSEYTANVKNSKGQTKANVYAGLGRPGTTRLYSTGSGTPRLDIASSGPANYGNGAGHRKVLSSYVAKDRRFPGPLRKFDRAAADDYYANRYFVGTEIVHRGDGTGLHLGVFEMVSRFAAILEEHYGWDERHIGHEDSTRRKVDPRFVQGEPYTMSAFRSRIVEIRGDEPPPPVPQEAPPMYSMYHGDGFDTGTRPGSDVPSVTKRSDVIHFQLKMIDLGFSPGKVDGKYGDNTATQLKAFLLSVGDKPVNDGRQFTGRNGYHLEKAFAALGDSGEPGEHSHPQYAKDGHSHKGYAILTHTHPVPSHDTLGATQP